ncbi:hypothetical protein FQZ97_859540 [compost metagenome]
MNADANVSRTVVIAVDAELVEPPLHVADTLVVEADDLPCLLYADAVEEELELDAQAASEIARVAPTRAEAGKFLLEDDDLRTESSQLQRSGQSSKASADHDHIGADIALQLWLHVSRPFHPPTEPTKMRDSTAGLVFRVSTGC